MNRRTPLDLPAPALCFFLLTAAFAWSASPDLASRFANPPPDTRILKIIHSWPDQSDAQDQLVAKLKRQGFGGVVCNVAFEQYMESEPKWQAFTRAVNEAKKAGMAMWIYDERGYPSGNAGGITLRNHPDWEARGLLIADAESSGAAVNVNVPPGRLVIAAAFPVRGGQIDLSGKADLSGQVRDGRIEWQRAGAWRVMAITEDRLFEGTHADGNLHAKIPYVNLLMPEPTARFIEVTHNAYVQRLGTNLSSYFMGAFTDEPSLMSLFLKPMPYRPLPWAPALQAEFKKRRGYALDHELLPTLIADAGPKTQKARYDYWLTIGELVSENFFGQLQTWGRKYGVPSGGHLLMEENITSHTALYGDFFRCIRKLDAPSIDCLTSVPPEVPWYIARLLASAGELEGNSLVMSETSDHSQRYRPAGDTRPKRIVTEAEIRGTCNRLMVGGVNNITSYYSFADLSDEQMQRINQWIGRCCTMLRGGHQVADIALLYPSESLWTQNIPSRKGASDATGAARIQTLYRAAADALFAAQRDFTFVDGRALAEARVEHDTLVHGKLRWRVVLLPGADTMPLAAWENLAKFVRGGGVVVALGARPANSETEFPSPAVQAFAAEIFGTQTNEPHSHPNGAGGGGIFLPNGSEGLLSLVLDGVLARDLNVSGARPPVRMTHRRIDGSDVYFVINDGAKPWAGELSFGSSSDAIGEGLEQWNPATGEHATVAKRDGVNLKLDPYGATFFRCATARVPARKAVGAGALPGLKWEPLPEVTPTEGHGQFVRAELSRLNLPTSPRTPWVARATLTKGQVDTHLFTSFRFPKPLDLTGAECLALDTSVPAGQSAASQILIILKEEGGGDFMANTGRSLGAPGSQRVFVPLSSFQMAGWSKAKDSDGVLDLTKVREINIGWGGYFGSEGERVEFTVMLPQVGRVLK